MVRRMQAAIPVRVVAGHRFTATAALLGAITWFVLPTSLGPTTRAVLAWDAGGLLLLALAAQLFARTDEGDAMTAQAMRQQEGEWVVFFATLAGVVASFVALTQELANGKDLAPGTKEWHVALVGVTLLVSWLVTHTLFALRYAHEFYAAAPDQGIDGGLTFPGTPQPDYWDFAYFSIVLGMTFQVSDVQITSRKLRRLATLHGFVGFVFNTVIVALTVNIAAALL